MGQSILFVVLLLTLAAAGCQANCGPRDHFCYLYPLHQRLEVSLVNNSQMLYSLRQAFFPLHRTVSPAISIKVCIKVREIQSENCSREGHSGEPAFNSGKKCWWYVWTSSALLSLITADELLAFENIIFLTVYNFIGPSMSHAIDLILQPESLPCMPSLSEMETTLTTLLSWIKAYTKAYGIPESWNGEDRGYVAIRHDYWITEGIDPSLKYNVPYFLRILLLALFIYLNIFVVMLSAQFAPHWYNKLKQMAIFSDQLMPIYWATIIVLVLFNTLFLIASLAVYSAHPRTGTCILHPETSLCKDLRSTDMYTDLMAAVIAKILILPLALMVEFIIAVRIFKDTGVPIPAAIEKLCWCFICCFSHNTRSKIIQTFVLWHMMIGLQLVAVSAIPLSITTIVSPGYTIPLIAISVSVILCFIVSVTHLLHPATTYKQTISSCQRRAGIKVVQLLKVITFFGLTVTLGLTLVFIYFTMLMYGVSSRKGAVGYIFPLLPYLPLSAFGYYIKRKFFSSEANSNQSDCHGRTLEHCTNISHSVSDEGRLAKQQLVFNSKESQFEETQPLIDSMEHSSSISDPHS